MSEVEESRIILAKHLLEDSSVRVRYQHEFSLAGFQALILINGGAIIGLLTYAGNLKDTVAAHELSGAFISYVIGLVSTVLAYLFAYYSQGLFMDVEMQIAIKLLGLDAAETSNSTKGPKGEVCIVAAVILTVIGLCAFIIGSWLAMSGLS
jgi:hypothetical protein